MENGLPQEKSGYAGDVYLLFQRLATRQLDVVLSAFFSMQHVAFPRGPEGLFFACKSMSLADVPTVKTLGSLGGSASHGEVQHQFSEHITGRPGPGMGDLLNQVNCRTVQFSATPSGFARVCLQFLGDFCVDPEGESPETGEDVVLL